MEYPFGGTEPMRCPAEFARRQEEEPVGRVRLATGEDAWLVTRYADIRALLADPRFRPWIPGTPASDGDGLLFTMAGENHARLRRIAAKALTPRRVAHFPELSSIRRIRQTIRRFPSSGRAAIRIC